MDDKGDEDDVDRDDYVDKSGFVDNNDVVNKYDDDDDVAFSTNFVASDGVTAADVFARVDGHDEHEDANNADDDDDPDGNVAAADNVDGYNNYAYAFFNGEVQIIHHTIIM